VGTWSYLLYIQKRNFDLSASLVHFAAQNTSAYVYPGLPAWQTSSDVKCTRATARHSLGDGGTNGGDNNLFNRVFLGLVADI
jgi:hypothetical protein